MTQHRDATLQPGRKGSTGAQGMRIGIKRIGQSVQIALQCDDDYQAIELYDRLVQAAEKGVVTLDLKARRV